MPFPMVANDRMRQGLLNFGTALATGGPGVPGDIGQGATSAATGLLNAQMQAIDPTGRVRAMSGQHRPLEAPTVPFSSEAMQQRLGGDPRAPESLLGFIGSPDVTDVGKLLVAAGAKGLLDPSLAMTLFHGTPHKFSKFDLERIGTGEGAQAYGHGLYFAESPGVAKSYRSAYVGDKTTGISFEDAIKEVHPDAKRKDYDDLWDSERAEIAEQYNVIADTPERLREAGYEFTEMHGMTDEQISASKYIAIDSYSGDIVAAGNSADEALDVAFGKGHLYEVDIPDETIGKMLDWDKPLSEQPENAQNAIRKILDQNEYSSKQFDDGQDFYKQFAENEGYTVAKKEGLTGRAAEERGQQWASEYFKEAGIPGIRYYDGSSRSAQKGTRNIVVFNPDDIKSVKRDGELVYKTEGL